MSEQAVINNETSSIGAVWPPITSSNNRIKGFYDCFVDTEQDAEVFMNEFSVYQAEVESHQDLDRLSIRALTSPAAIAALDSAGVILEGALPVRNTQGLAIVYAAWNAPGRTVSEERLKGHQNALEKTIATPLQPSHTFHDIRQRIINQHTSDEEKHELVESFVDLYGSFGYDKDDVEDILLSPANTIAYIEDDRGIVSTAMAERATLDIEGHGQIRMAEITEAITRPDSRGQGFYRVISGYLIKQLLDPSHEQLDVIYGEGNMAVPGVLISAHQNGRRFSYFDRQNLGVQQAGFGILQQSFSVEDGVEERPYNDFALSYLPL